MRHIFLLVGILLSIFPLQADETDLSYVEFSEAETHLFPSPENGPILTLKLVPSADHTRIKQIDIYKEGPTLLQSLPVPEMDRPVEGQKYFKILAVEPVSYYGFSLLAKEAVVRKTEYHGRGIGTFWRFWKYNPTTQLFEVDTVLSQIPGVRFLPEGTIQSWLIQDVAGWERAYYIYRNGNPLKISELEGRLEEAGYHCYETRFNAKGSVRKKVKCPPRTELSRPAE